MFDQRQRHFARISIALSLLLIFAGGCRNDPNTRKLKYLESGKKYEANGAYREAVIEFSNALKIDKRYAPAHYELAKTYLKMNSALSAISELMRTIEYDPNNLDARLTYGDVLLAGDAPDRAQTQANAVLAKDPNNADAYGLLAGVAELEGNDPDALKYTQRALAIDPNRAAFHSALALLEAKDPANQANAEQEFRDAATLDPKSASPHLLLAALLEKKNDLSGAEQQFLTAISIEPQNLRAREDLANLYLHVGNQPKAEQTLYQAAIDMQNNDAASAVLAQYYARAGQADRSLTVFADLSSKYPKGLGIRLTYARLLYERKDYAQSTAVLSVLSKTDSTNAQVETLNAQLLLTEGKTEDAFNLLKKAVRDNPSSVEAYLLLARVANVKGDSSTAEVSFREAEKLDPGNIEAASGLAHIAIARNDVPMLAELADKEIHVHPNYLYGYLWRAAAELGNKEIAKADADLQAVIKAAPDNATAYLELGQVRVAQGRMADARPLFEKALDKDPNSNLALSMLLLFDLQAKQPAKAIARIQAQITKVPGNADLYGQLASLQMMTLDYKGALQSSTKAMQLNPGNSDAMQTYSHAEVALGDTDSAISVWQNWLNSHPSDVHALDILGSLEQAKGDSITAMDNYKKALTINSSDPTASNNLAFLMVEDGENADVALSLAQTARRVLPNNPQTADTLAWVYYYKGSYGQAQELLETALKTDPNSAIMHYHLGMTYLKMNDKANAQLHLKKAVALNPKGKVGLDANRELQKAG